MKIHRRWVRCFAAVLPLALGTLSVAHVAQATVKRAIPAYSVRLEDQLLADLSYLPVAFQPTVPHSPSTTTTTTTTTTLDPTTSTSTTSTSTTTSLPTTTTTLKRRPAVSPVKLVPGHFKWRFPNLPRSVQSQWRVGTNNVVLKGALMRFQSVHNLATTGSMDGTTWRTLVNAVLRHRRNPSTYNVVYVTQSLPEKARLYANGRLVYTTLVNTGISQASTAPGTYPVYLRYTTTTMSGTEPNGTTYHDTGIPWVSYFNGGDALHGFIRSSYGYPQSLGCVEMTFNSAASIWPRTPIGTLVSVR